MSHSTQVPTVGAARQSLLYICEEWPNPYKPTWDAQIRSLMELGFEVSVVHCSRHYSEQYDSWRAAAQANLDEANRALVASIRNPELNVANAGE